MSYCTPADVSSQLRLSTQDGDLNRTRVTFSTTTDPTLAEVTEWIAEAEAEIDRMTRTSFGGLKQVTEVHTVRTPWRNTGGPRSIILTRSRVADFDDTEDDKLERWDGVEWEDISEEGGWWLDERGIIHMESSWLPTYHSPVRIVPKTTKYRVTYRYGSTTVPGDIKRACVLMVARRYVESDWYRKSIPTQSGESISPMTVLNRYDEQITAILNRYTDSMRVIAL